MTADVTYQHFDTSTHPAPKLRPTPSAYCPQRTSARTQTRTTAAPPRCSPSAERAGYRTPETQGRQGRPPMTAMTLAPMKASRAEKPETTEKIETIETTVKTATVTVATVTAAVQVTVMRMNPSAPIPYVEVNGPSVHCASGASVHRQHKEQRDQSEISLCIVLPKKPGNCRGVSVIAYRSRYINLQKKVQYVCC
jgi:hypothetical protein